MNDQTALAQSGRDKIDWARCYMPLLARIEREFADKQPFAGKRIASSIHLEAKTARLIQALRAGGAEVFVTGSNPLSTQDDIVAALQADGFQVAARHGAAPEEYDSYLRSALSVQPHLIIDDGGDFSQLLHGPYREYAAQLIGGCEETTTGIIRLRGRERAGTLAFPMFNINDADCKHLFDNRYGTGQSTLTAIMAVTNLSITMRAVVVAGYGWCGRGVAMRARGMGARVIVTEVDPVKALEAVMDGYEVMTMDQAAAIGDIFITVTGCCDVITARHFERMKDGVILANSGHFDVEISKPDLAALAAGICRRKPDIIGYRMADGRMLNLLAEGRLVNLAAGMGHPVEIMDLSFALQAKCLQYLAETSEPLENRLYAVPKAVDQEVAALRLAALGLDTERLTAAQERYLAGGAD